MTALDTAFRSLDATNKAASAILWGRTYNNLGLVLERQPDTEAGLRSQGLG